MPMAVNAIKSVHFTNTVRQSSAAILQNFNLTAEEVDFLQQVSFAYSMGTVLLIALTLVAIVVVLNIISAALTSSNKTVASRPSGFSLWQLVTTLVNQNEYDPVDKLRRFLFLVYLVFTFIVLNVALNDVGTKLVVTEPTTARSLQDLYELDSNTGLYLIKEDWTTSKFHDVNMKKVNRVYVKQCESKKGHCSVSHHILLKMYADIAAGSFKIVVDQIVGGLLSRFFCAASVSLDSEHDQLIITKLDDVTTAAAIAYSSKISSAYRDIINSAAKMILESGLAVDGLFERARDDDDEILFSWRACAMDNPLDDKSGHVRPVTVKNFAWVAKISALVLIIATILITLEQVLSRKLAATHSGQERGLHVTRRYRIAMNRTILLLSPTHA
ncbi:hypothetical protein HDE_02279 [Halotydeus destructor]|nr:hypothetical protein HDE_02279 [Halotydeus destructor]